MKKDSEAEDPDALKKRLFDESDDLLRRIAGHLISDPESEKHYSATLVRLAKRWIEQNPDPLEANPVKQTAKKVMEPINDTKQPVKTRQINVRVTAEQDRLLKQYCVRNGVTTQDAVIKALQCLIDGF